MMLCVMRSLSFIAILQPISISSPGANFSDEKKPMNLTKIVICYEGFYLYHVAGMMLILQLVLLMRAFQLTVPYFKTFGYKFL